jgi:hypothetical protein
MMILLLTQEELTILLDILATHDEIGVVGMEIYNRAMELDRRHQDMSDQDNPQPITNPEYEPPSIASGTVSEDLVRSMAHLVNEYGAAGVRSTLREMTDGAQLAYMGTDATKWAHEFVAMHGGDESLMIGWFANAIEAGKAAL